MMSASALDAVPVADALSDRQGFRRYHVAVLGLSLAVIATSLCLTTPNDRQVAVAGLPELPLPELCQSRVWLKLECPGCGLTRSFIHFFHGRWDDSLRMHRLGWFLAALTVLQIPYRLAALAHPTGLPLGRVFPQAIGYGLLALLAVNWLAKLAGV